MKKKYMLAIALCLLSGGAHASKMQGPSHREEAPMPLGPKIRVLLAKNVPSALIEAKGAYRVVQREAQELISSGVLGKRYIMHAIYDGLRWGEEYPGTYHVTLVPSNRETTLYVNGFQYKGVLDIYLEPNQQITVVNEIAIEDYIRSTIALQLPTQWSPEALSAYIIAARTEAYALSLSGKNSPERWDVQANDVGYFGHGVALQHNGAEEAIEATRFMVLEATKGRLPEHIYLPKEKLEELARSGCDAKQILSKCCPNTRLNVTADPSARVLR